MNTSTRSLLDAHVAALVADEQAFLEQLHALLVQLEGSDSVRKAVRQALRDVTDLFLLVVVGEFNAGKSAVINALLGEPILEEGVTPTTAHIHLIRYGERPGRVETSDGMVIVTYPAVWLRHMVLVDTPGTNAVIRRHQEVTEEFIPRSDLVLFVTSADRPFTESERAFLGRIREWGKKVIFVVNKIDLLTPEERAEVLAYVEDNARHALGMTPTVFGISARLAQEARRVQGDQHQTLWNESQMGELESFIHHSLDERERLRLKLSAPLGVARRALEEAISLAGARADVLRADVEALDRIEKHLNEYAEDMRRQWTFRLSHVDNALHEMAARGHRFFDETIRLGRIFDLLNSDKLKREFEQYVVADTPLEVERHVNALIDWMVEQEFREWQAIERIIREQSQEPTHPFVSGDDQGFEAKRRRLLNSVGRAAREVVASYNKEEEVRALVESVHTTLAQTALVEVGAVGVGAIIVALVHGILLDMTGILGAGLIAAAGLYLLPARRERARRELVARVETLREELRRVLTEAFEQELARSIDGMRDALGPYARFVRAEQQRITEITRQLEGMERTLREIESRVHAL